METIPTIEPKHGLRRYDLTAIAGAVWPAAAFWLFAILILAILGEWRTVLLTPLAWWLAIPVARRCVHASRNSRTSLVVTEATVAGAFLGLILAGIALILVYLVSPYRNLAFATIVIVLSFVAPALIASLVARRSLRNDPGFQADG